jgi:hypothetical protein
MQDARIAHKMLPAMLPVKSHRTFFICLNLFLIKNETKVDYFCNNEVTVGLRWEDTKQIRHVLHQGGMWIWGRGVGALKTRQAHPSF